MSNGTQRRLAAILVADVVGYTRLMEIDETRTLAAMKAHRRELWQPMTDRFGGRVFATAGDGLLAEFASAVAAVECAIAVQRGMVERNSGLADERRLRLRIGINIGEVIVDGNDVYGDGVNIAARLEPLSEPGGVAISANVHEQVRGKIEDVFRDAGPHRVKNISRPVQVWRWSADEPTDAGATTSEVVSLTLPDKPSIAVLPFDNMSGDSEQEHFADGIAEDIITGLSAIRSFFVIARNSSFTYKGRSIDVSQVAGELGVRYVLEGSVRRAGGRIRVNAQLIDAPSRHHIWAERFDRDLEDIFQVQDEITGAIVAAIGPEVDGAERERALRRPTEHLDAWSAYQRGLWHTYRFTQADTEAAGELLRRAVALDPAFAAAYAGLSFVCYSNAFLGYVRDREQAIAEGFALARRSIALDDRDPVAHWALGRICKLRGEHESAISEFETAISLNPSYAQAHYNLGWALALVGEPERALACLDRALRLSPRDPLLFAFMIVRANAHLQMGDEDAALSWAEKAARQPNAHAHTMAFYAAVLHRRGRHEQAAAVIANILAERPEYTCALYRQSFIFKRPEYGESVIEAMRAAGLPD